MGAKTARVKVIQIRKIDCCYNALKTRLIDISGGAFLQFSCDKNRINTYLTAFFSIFSKGIDLRFACPNQQPTSIAPFEL